MINYVILGTFIVGLIFVIKGIIEIKKIYSCTVPVKGFFMETSKERVGRGWVHYHTYSYRYEGKDYYSKSSLGVTQKLIDSRFIGSEYTICLNEKNPRIFVAERKPSANGIFCIVTGVLIFLIPLLLTIYIML